MRYRLVSAMVLLFALLPAAARGETTTVTFRQGADGYEGLTDASVHIAHRFTRDASGELLAVSSGDFYPEGFVLLRADLASIPQNASVTKAELTLIGGSGKPVRITAHRVLRAWRPGEVNWRQATGEDPWCAPGMQAGVDYTADPLGAVAAGGQESTEWVFEVTDAVRDWVRRPEGNFGLVLRGQWPAWKVGPSRTFGSSEASDADARPALTVSYDPATPLARAGEDRRAGPDSPVRLDAGDSRSSAGTAEGLTYAWRVVDKPSSSALPEQISQEQVTTFQPDVPGEYVVELTVTDEQGRSGTDTVTVRPAIPTEHPRIWITPARLSALKEKVEVDPDLWQLVTAKCAQAMPGGEVAPYYERKEWQELGKVTGLANCALNYLLTGDERQGREAVMLMLHNCDHGLDLLRYDNGKVGAVHVGITALAYDWCRDLLTDQQRRDVIARLNQWANWCIAEGKGRDDPASNYFYRYLWVEAAVALATYHENPQAERILRHARSYMLDELARPWFARWGEGGDWPNGNGRYDGPLYLAYTLAALKTATGEDLFADLPFLKDSIRYHVHATLPAVSPPFEAPPGRYDQQLLQELYESGPCLIYPSGEYTPDGYGVAVPSLFAYPEHTQYVTLLCWGLPGGPEAELGRRWMGTVPGVAEQCAWAKPHKTRPLTQVVEFLFGQGEAEGDPGRGLPRLYRAASTGFVTWRSGWGPDATFMAFECGPRLSANQRRGANGIFIYKRGYLMGHVPNVRLDTNNSATVTIDGFGQVVMPREAEPRLLACADHDEYVYVAGDAGGAYNSAFFGRDVCEEFTRQVVVLPPGLFVIFDRVRPTDPTSECEFLCHFGDRRFDRGRRLYARDFGGEVSGEPGDVFVSRTDWGGTAYVKVLSPERFEQDDYRMRLAVVPSEPGPRQNFLVVIYVPRMEAGEHPRIQSLSGEDACGLEGSWGRRSFQVRFNREGPVGGHILLKDQQQVVVDTDLK